jgi:hypothetical protein
MYVRPAVASVGRRAIARSVQTVRPVSRRGDHVANKTPPSQSVIAACSLPRMDRANGGDPTIDLPGSRPSRATSNSRRRCRYQSITSPIALIFACWSDVRRSPFRGRQRQKYETATNPLPGDLPVCELPRSWRHSRRRTGLAGGGEGERITSVAGYCVPLKVRVAQLTNLVRHIHLIPSIVWFLSVESLQGRNRPIPIPRPVGNHPRRRSYIYQETSPTY